LKYLSATGNTVDGWSNFFCDTLPNGQLEISTTTLSSSAKISGTTLGSLTFLVNDLSGGELSFIAANTQISLTSGGNELPSTLRGAVIR
jgi:hypothetical protein